MLVPKRAVVEQGNDRFVWVVADRTALRRAVQLGADRIDQVEVKSGVMPGDAVILNAPAELTNRAVVRIRQGS